MFDYTIFAKIEITSIIAKKPISPAINPKANNKSENTTTEKKTIIEITPKLFSKNVL